MSLEIAVLCDPSGVGLRADERARRRIRVAPGGALADLCVPGTTPKAHELTRRGSADVVEPDYAPGPTRSKLSQGLCNPVPNAVSREIVIDRLRHLPRTGGMERRP